MNKYPMLLIPCPREMIWGGNRLKTKYLKPAPFEKLGESWELTVRNEAQSVIANGEYKGRLLSEVINCSSFPLLIKFIDACDRLSVQVHPDDDIKDENGTPLGKTEMWYIIEAEKDAHIIYGLSDGIDIDEFKKRVLDGDCESALKKVKVSAGDCFFIPAGQVHAIGKGILICEIQQNSDTTYRLYDYGRVGKDNKPRELHIDSALKVIKAYTKDDIQRLRFRTQKKECCLADCDKFSCCKYCSTTEQPVHYSTENSFSAVIFINGSGEISYNGERYPAKAGDCFYLPEDMDITVHGNTEFLCAKP